MLKVVWGHGYKLEDLSPKNKKGDNA